MSDTATFFANSAIQQFVYYDKYARWRDDLGRREHWPETVERTTDFLRELSENKLSESDYELIHKYMLTGDVSPSMRLFATAGAQARRSHISIYNCCYMPINSIDAICELLLVSMNGVGAGYSVERRYINLLPPVQKQVKSQDVPTFVIPDDTEGWVEALQIGLVNWFGGRDIQFDYSQIRPAGAILETKGGTASGPGVLQDLLDFTRRLILSKQGDRLRPVDVFDICTSVGGCAVSGGSRRSAQLTMFDIDDNEMLFAKAGKFWERYPNRANANISVVIEHELSREEMSRIMGAMFASGTGEPGVVSRRAMNITRPSRRRYMDDGGLNACSEINLQGATPDGRLGGEFCNLSSIQIYPEDTEASLEAKVKAATIIGTIQAMATDFNGLRPEWKEICDEERLLGVSLVGQMDNPIAQNPDVMNKLRKVSRETNRIYAKRLGINPAVAIGTCKPSGNSSVLFGTARGINARYAPYYIRRVRVNAYTPMYQVLKDAGVPMVPENGQKEPYVDTYVATFYEKSPDSAVTIDQLSAIDQLEYWKRVKLNWAEHNVSTTIEFLPEEQQSITNWGFENQDILNGVSFLPRNDHIYENAPYEQITKEEYEAAIKDYPEIDFSRLQLYESFDTSVREIECSAGVCDLF